MKFIGGALIFLLMGCQTQFTTSVEEKHLNDVAELVDANNRKIKMKMTFFHAASNFTDLKLTLIKSLLTINNTQNTIGKNQRSSDVPRNQPDTR